MIATIPDTPAPLPSLTASAARLANCFAKARDLPQSAGQVARVIAPPASIPDPLTFGLVLACGAARLTAPGALVHSLLTMADPAAISTTDPWRTLLLELVLDGPLGALAGFHPPLALLDIVPSGDSDMPYALGLIYAGYPVRLDFPEPTAGVVAAALAALPACRHPVIGLAVTLHARVAAATVLLSELRAAQPGSVIQVRRAPDDGVLLVAGERLVWHARAQAGCLHVTSSRQRAGRLELEQMWMDDDPAGGDEARSLDDLPVRLSFELGQLEMPLAELETVNPGHVFQLGRDEADAVDIIANGRRIGAGRVVLVAGSPGVQITRLGPK